MNKMIKLGLAATLSTTFWAANAMATPNFSTMAHNKAVVTAASHHHKVMLPLFTTYLAKNHNVTKLTLVDNSGKSIASTDKKSRTYKSKALKAVLASGKAHTGKARKNRKTGQYEQIVITPVLGKGHHVMGALIAKVKTEKPAGGKAKTHKAKHSHTKKHHAQKPA
jgi:hypothetical protein